MPNVDQDPFRSANSIYVRIVVFLFPLIILWILSLVGISYTFKFSDIVSVLFIWILTEASLTLFLLRSITNKSDLLKHLIFNFGIFNLLAFSSVSFREFDRSHNDWYSIEYVAVALFSLLLASALLLLCACAVFSLIGG